MYGVTLLPVSPVMTLATSSGAATCCIATLLRANLEPSLAVLWSGSRRPTFPLNIAGTCASISRPESMKWRSLGAASVLESSGDAYVPGRAEG